MTENKKGYEYEDFVFKCFNAIYAWMNNCPDLKNKFKIKKGVKLPTYNGTTTNQIDIYIEYTQPGGLVVKTAVECKKREIIEIGQIRDFNDKLRKIKNINGIFAYSGIVQQGVIDYATEENICLWNIEQLIKKIQINLVVLPEQRYDIKITPELDKNFCKDEELKKMENNKFGCKGIMIDDIEYLIIGKQYNFLFEFFTKLSFLKNTIDNIHTSYTKQCNNMYVILDDFSKIKTKKITFLLKKIMNDNRKPITTTLNIDISKDDSFAHIKDVLTGKEKIVFESGQIKEKV